MKLIICGNGFDIHSGLRTCYCAYRRYLKTNAPSVLESFEKFPWLNISCKENLWSNLENTLAIDFHNMAEFYKQHYCDENGSQEYRLDFEEWTRFIYSFTGEEFYKWISSEVKNAKKDASLELLFRDAVCVTFNYTDTIERLYGVEINRVLHIHGSLNNVKNDECLGGNILPFFKSAEEAEIFAKPIIESDIWNSDIIRAEIQFGAPLSREEEARNIIHSIQDELIKRDFVTIVEKTTKKLYNNMEKLQLFLDGKEIEEVVILGPSLLGADEIYYSQYFIPKYKDVKWVAYFHEDKEEKEIFFNKYKIIPEYKKW